jgi:hypothetical protein
MRAAVLLDIMNTYRRILRGAEATHPYWVVLPEERCVGENFYLLRNFCETRSLSLSRHGRTFARREGYYQVFMFAEAADADLFCQEFSGERMHASERQSRANWEFPNWNRTTKMALWLFLRVADECKGASPAAAPDHGRRAVCTAVVPRPHLPTSERPRRKGVANGAWAGA